MKAEAQQALNKTDERLAIFSSVLVRTVTSVASVFTSDILVPPNASQGQGGNVESVAVVSDEALLKPMNGIDDLASAMSDAQYTPQNHNEPCRTNKSIDYV